MAEKSDGDLEDNIIEKIKLLEQQKNDLIIKRKQNEEKNCERKQLEARLKDLQGEVTTLRDTNAGGDKSSDLSALRESRDRIHALQNQFLDPSSLAGLSRSSHSSRRNDEIDDSSTDDDVHDVMSLRHKQAIQLNRDILVENLISDDIFNDLIANKILTTADVGRIKEKNTREAINEELLNNLIRRSDKAFYVFVRSLRKTLQEYLANRLDPASSAKKKKRKRQAGELNVNVDCDEVTPVNKRQQTCSCQEVEEQILLMAKTAYRNIRRRDETPASFEQFRKELRETNNVVKDSMEIMHTLKILCRHGDMTNVSHGSIRFTLLCSSVIVVKDLWKIYQSGELLTIFQNGLVTKNLRRRCRARSIRLRVRIAEDEYLTCLRELDAQLNCQVNCKKKFGKKLLRTRKLRLRERHPSSENIPTQHATNVMETNILQKPNNPPVPTPVLSPRIPFYDLRNRQIPMSF